MLAIRLARIGRKNRPSYRIIVSEKARDTYGKALEILGYYDPRSKVMEVKKDRVTHWVSMGAQPSPTLNNIFINQNVLSGEKKKTSYDKKKRKEAVANAKAEMEKKIQDAKKAEAEASAAKKEEAPAPSQGEADGAPAEEKKVENTK